MYTATLAEHLAVEDLDIDHPRRVLGTDQPPSDTYDTLNARVSRFPSRAPNLERLEIEFMEPGYGNTLAVLFPRFSRGRTITGVCFRNLRSIPELCSTRIHGNSIDSIHRCSFSFKFAEMDTTFVWPRTCDLGSRLRLLEKNASAAPQMQTCQKHWDQTPTRRRSVDDKSSSI